MTRARNQRIDIATAPYYPGLFNANDYLLIAESISSGSETLVSPVYV
jgi:hypothetical protein